MTRVETRVVCPAEVTQTVEAAPAMPADAALTAAKPVLDWIAARFAWGDDKARRLTDAQAVCREQAR